ncbi:MAG: hypothetical protein U9R15_07475, partial [Chloroflexota bacterium]|nr:hypothetical protein [Chloroflexota bacterium]
MPKDRMKAQVATPAGQLDVELFDRWRLAMIAGAIACVGFYVLLYIQTGDWQLLIQAGAILVGLGCAAAAHTLIRQAKFDAAGYWMLIGVAVAYSSAELFFDGATLYLAVGGVLLNLLVGGLVLPRKWPVWLITTGLFGIFVLLVNLFEPLPRYDIAQSPLLNVIIPGITGLLVLLTFWQISRAFTIGNIRTRLLIAFVSLVLLTA